MDSLQLCFQQWQQKQTDKMDLWLWTQFFSQCLSSPSCCFLASQNWDLLVRFLGVVLHCFCFIPSINIILNGKLYTLTEMQSNRPLLIFFYLDITRIFLKTKKKEDNLSLKNKTQIIKHNVLTEKKMLRF